jgi:hypothetical protein
MAFYRGPRIVTSGLVLALDAANPKSYAYGSTIWNDLSGNLNSGSLNNAPALNNDSYGSFVFNGVNNYALLPANFFNHDSGSAFTVSFWFKTSTAGVIFGQQNTIPPTNATGYVPAIYVDSTGKIRTSCFWGGATNNQSVSTLTVTDNVWHNVAVTFSSGSQISYVDGNSFATLAKTQTNYAATYYYLIGTGAWGGWTDTTGNPFFTGSISNMAFYNRALSAAEVAQNYNAIGSRFQYPLANISTYLTLTQAAGLSIYDNTIENTTYLARYSSYASASAFALVNEPII